MIRFEKLKIFVNIDYKKVDKFFFELVDKLMKIRLNIIG